MTQLRKVPIEDSGEPLVDYSQACPGIAQVEPVFEYSRATLVRESVADMLNRAVANLPDGHRLGVLEGWRPRYIQRRMWLTSWLRFRKLHPEWSDVHLRRVVNRYVAPPDSVVPPPHSTGAAIDIFLVDELGKILDHSSPFQPFDTKVYSMDAPGLSDEARLHRGILRSALEGTGLTNYPSEWWHWSYGDQGWAYRAGDGRSAIYGPIDRPDHWSPVPEDDKDEPLLRLYAPDPSGGYPRVASK